MVAEVTRRQKWLYPSYQGCLSRRRVALGAFAIGGVTLAGCLSSNYNFFNYVSSSGADMYFKVPATWSDFGPGQVFSTPQQSISPGQLAQIESGDWANVFSAQRTTSIQALTGIFASQPFGITQARKLSTSQRDTFSLASLRTLLIPSDPLASSTSSASGAVYTAENYSEFVGPGGMRGSRMVVDIKQTGKLTSVLSQVAEVDSSTNWVYLIGVGCTKACYQANKAVINEIVNSWSVRSPK